MKSLTDFRKMVEASVDRSATGIDTSVGSRGDDEWGKKSRRKNPRKKKQDRERQGRLKEKGMLTCILRVGRKQCIVQVLAMREEGGGWRHVKRAWE